MWKRCAGPIASLAVFVLAGCQTALPRVAYDPATMDPVALDPHYPPAMEPVTIGSQGAKLYGILYLAQGAGPHPTAILLHGYPGNERNLDLAHAIRRAGWNTLFFNYRGSWGSGGTFSIAHALEDVGAALAFLRSADTARRYRIDARRLTVIGHSLGGYLAMEAAAAYPAIRCAASLAGANLGQFGEMARRSETFAKELANYIDTAASVVGVDGKASVARWRDNAPDYDLRRLVPRLAGKTMLLVGAQGDDIVPLEQHHRPLVRTLTEYRHPALTVRILDTDHVFSSQRIALARLVIAWLGERCVE